MKKLIPFCSLFFIMFTVKAQSEPETLEWLRTKQPSIVDVSSNGLGAGNGKLTIDQSSIKISYKETSTNIEWYKIKDITNKLSQITIVSNDIVEGKNVFIRLRLDIDTYSRYLKAVKHMATLKGAKMVKDDLF